ncbi:MAG: CPBP family intramembrane metalloprotease [Cryobacterium sp.]|nr:CPBP family intramembrane metalloprotease [Oligoflexia bacterium]
MMNVFESYRDALERSGGDLGQGLEKKSSGDLFLEPFRVEHLTNPWVYVPLILVAGYTAYDYSSQVRSGLTPTQPLTRGSNRFLAFNQMALYPVGSGAPEEMFYRGFVQNEAYFLTRSSWASVLLSSAAFSLSHSPEGRVTAAFSGLYTGFLASHYHGALGPGIALHFWAVLFLGIESYLLVKKSQAAATGASPLALQFSLSF